MQFHFAWHDELKTFPNNIIVNNYLQVNSIIVLGAKLTCSNKTRPTKCHAFSMTITHLKSNSRSHTHSRKTGSISHFNAYRALTSLLKGTIIIHQLNHIRQFDNTVTKIYFQNSLYNFLGAEDVKLSLFTKGLHSTAHMHAYMLTAGTIYTTRRKCRELYKRVKFSSVGCASKYGTNYKQQQEEELPFVSCSMQSEYSFLCWVSCKDVSCRYQGKAELRRHEKCAEHQIEVRSSAGSSRPTVGFVPVGTPLDTQVY